MADPFEEAPGMTPPASIATAGAGVDRRESTIRQAISFLRDPRVQAADAARAVDFLRSKGVADDELREAFHRVGRPFPDAAAAAGAGASAPAFAGFAPPPPHAQHAQHALAVPFPPPPHAGPHAFPAHGPNVGPSPPGAVLLPPPPPEAVRRRPSWVSVFLGLTAAAGVYTAVREVLRQYVVPMYFPDAARLAEERRRRDEHSLVSQERQIAELRERIHDLCASSRQTTDRVEQLTRSLSTSLAMREREMSEASELRDAIRQLSHSISASGGTELSRHATANGGAGRRMDADTRCMDDSGERRSVGAMKDGALAYSGRVGGSGGGGGGTAERDEFMEVEPAMVEESWRTAVVSRRGGVATPGESRVSVKRGWVDERVSELEQAVGGGGLADAVAKLATEGSASGTGSAVARVDGESSTEVTAANDVATSTILSSTTSTTKTAGAGGEDDEARIGNGRVAGDIVEPIRGGRGVVALGGADGEEDVVVGINGVNGDDEARRAFENDFLFEAHSRLNVEGDIATGGGNDGLVDVGDAEAKVDVELVRGRRRGGRPLSLPAMDAPLSDTEC